MANITRIKNNQITDNTIEYGKIKSGTLVGANFNPDLTLNSNVTILGNLTIANSYTQLNSVNTYVNDPLVVFNNNYTGSPTYDIGILVNRNLSSLAPYGAVNAAFVWKEADNAFEAVMTTETGTTAGSINNSGWANVKLGNLTAITATIDGALTAGSASFASINNTPIGNATPSAGNFTTLASTNFSSGNAVISGGYISALANATVTTATLTTATITNETATNFYTANAVVDGGYIQNLANVTAALGYIATLNTTAGNATTLVATNFSSGNIAVTGGYAKTLANVYATEGYFANLSSANISGVTNGNFTTLVSTNLSTGNAQITGGSATGLTDLTATTAQATNFSTGNAQITGGSATGLTDLTATTAQATNFSSGNIAVTGGYASGLANASATYGTFTNLSSGNLLITSLTVPTLNATDGNITTLVATNFSTGNAQITGGSATGLTDLTATTAQATNFSSGNAQVTGGSATGLTDLTATTAQATNFSSGNIAVTGGYAKTLANVYATDGYFTNLSSANISGVTNGNFTTLVATNFSSGNIAVTGGYAKTLANLYATEVYGTNFSTGNARIAGGYADNFPIGANTKATGAFTTLTSDGITTFTNGTDSTSTSTGALQVTGGVGVSGNVWIGGNLYVANLIATTQSVLTVQDPLLYLQASDPGSTYNYDIGFYSDNTVAGIYSHTGLARNASANVWAFFSNVQSEPGATSINWNDAGLIYDTVKAGALTLANSTATTSATTGALVVAGGVGIGGDLYAYNLNATSANIGTVAFTNFSSGNVAITGGYAKTLANVYATEGYFTNLSSANISGVTNGNFTTLVATNLSTGNAQITGGSILGLTDLTATTAQATNFSSGNIAVTGGYAKTLANVYATEGYFGSFSTPNAVVTTETVTNQTTTNFYTANAVVNGGYIQNLANITATTSYIVNENITNGNATTLVATNFSSGNVAVTGGYAKTLANLYATELYGTNFSTGNAQITGGSATGLTDLTATTAQATNFSSGNAVITGGSINGSPIGATSASTGKFTTLTTTGVTLVEGNIVANSHTPSTSTTTGAIVIPFEGGIGIGGNIHAGLFGTSLHNIQGNILFGRGGTQAADSAVTVNLTTEIPITSNAIIHVSGNNSKAAHIAIDSFGSGAPSTYMARHARGVAGTPLSVQSKDGLGAFQVQGYGDTGYADNSNRFASGIAVYANENFTDSAQGTYVSIQAVPDGTIESQYGLLVFGNGQVVVNQSVASTSATTGALRVDGGAGIGGNVNVAGDVVANGQLIAASATNSTTPTTGALVVIGGAGIQSNVFIGGSTTLGSNRAAGYDTITQGKNDATLVWARSGNSYDQVVIGGSALAANLVVGAKLQINSTDSILIPVGTSSQRPGASGGTDTTGMLRYNTTTTAPEYFDGTAWTGFASNFTVITDEQFNGNGVDDEFTLAQATTTAASIVSINGVMQIPTLAYAITGAESKTLTFTEIPEAGDIIDVRRLTTTSTVGGISSVSGYMQVVCDNYGANILTGTTSATVTTSFEPGGAQVSYVANVSVASANTATTIDSFDKTKYRSAKYIVQVTNGADYQVSEVLVIHDGTTATRAMYGTMDTNGNLGVTSATISGGNVLLQYVATNVTNNVRIKKDYIAI